MNITILEDNIEHAIRLETVIRDIAKDLHISVRVHTTGKIAEFQESVKLDRAHHLYFLDLDLQGNQRKGFEMAELVRERNPFAIIVFVTTMYASAPLAFEYRISALDFIPKNADNFKDKVKGCIEYALQQSNTVASLEKREDILYYHYRGKLELKVPFEDIFYIETTAISHKLLIQARNFRMEFYGTIADIVHLDEKQRLFKVDRSTLINIDNIASINKKARELIFFDGSTYPLAFKRLRIVEKLLLNKKDEI
ncbi:MAG: DNA-binding response regulator [Candidatus Saccharibacteria bacterium]|nr:DNA-binding response regulator [Candidatus Saccharibacteria bacterium]